MTRWISLLVILTLLLGLCACGTEPGTLIDKDTLIEAVGGKNSPSPDVPTPSAAPDVTASAEPKETGTVVESVDAYVTVEDTETSCGRVSIPQLTEAKLDTDEVRVANAMFRSIRDQLLERVELCLSEWGGESYRDANYPLCTTQYALNGSLLSVLVSYTRLEPYSESMDCFASVNIDVSTGEALDHRQVFQAAGFTEDQVKAALRCYVDRYVYYEWEHITVSEIAGSGQILSSLGEPEYNWQGDVDQVVATYDAPPESQGEPWDTLPYHPATYFGEDGLAVRVRGLTAAGAGYYEMMIRIGHDDDETLRLNPYTPGKTPFRQSPLMVGDAYDVVSRGMGLDSSFQDSQGVQYGLSAEYMDYVELDGEYQVAYLFKASTLIDEQLEDAGWYAVTVFTGTLWQQDSTTGVWMAM